MWEHKETDIEQRGDAAMLDDSLIKRYPLVMVPKDNDFDP